LRVTKAGNRIKSGADESGAHHKYIAFRSRLSLTPIIWTPFLHNCTRSPMLASDGPPSCRFSGTRSTLS
jgi:hypothetical protein